MYINFNYKSSILIFHTIYVVKYEDKVHKWKISRPQSDRINRKFFIYYPPMYIFKMEN